MEDSCKDVQLNKQISNILPVVPFPPLMLKFNFFQMKHYQDDAMIVMRYVTLSFNLYLYLFIY